MGKKIALGCAVVLVLAMVVGGIAFYQFVYKPGKEMLVAGKEYVESLSGLGEVVELEEGVEDRSAYAAPESGELAPEQVERFLAVQRTVRDDLGARWGELTREYESRPEGREPTLQEMLDFWSDLTETAKAAKRAQVEALNEQRFSTEEYRWVKRQVYAAAGAEALAVDLSQVVEAAKEGRFDDLRAMAERYGDGGGEGNDAEVGGEVPDWVPRRNVELVEPHRDELRRAAPLALLGRLSLLGGALASARQELEADLDGAAGDHPELPRGGVREIDDPPTVERAAVVDPHRHRLAARFVGDPHRRAERQGAVGGGQPGRPVGFAAGGGAALERGVVVAGRAAAELLRRPRAGPARGRGAAPVVSVDGGRGRRACRPRRVLFVSHPGGDEEEPEEADGQGSAERPEQAPGGGVGERRCRGAIGAGSGSEGAGRRGRRSSGRKHAVPSSVALSGDCGRTSSLA